MLSLLLGNTSAPISAWDNPWAWMRRRLRVTLGIAAILLFVQTVSVVNEESAVGENRVASPPPALRTTSAAAAPRSVLPEGWRRTASGWQHVSTWGNSASVFKPTLGELVIAQRDAEPRWLRRLMRWTRQTPPGYFAMAQLTGVFAVFSFFRRRGDQTCPRPRRYFFREPNGARPVTSSPC